MHGVHHFLASAVLTWSVCSAAGPSTGYWRGLGCFTSPDAQGLEIKKDIPLVSLTPDSCNDACSEFVVSGVRNGTECWCGNILKGKQTNGIDCNILCPGYPYEDCGGKGTMEIHILYGADVSTQAPGSSASSTSSSSPSSTAHSANTTTSPGKTTQAADASKSTEKSQPTGSAGSSASATQGNGNGSGKSGAARGLDTSTGVVMAGLLGLCAVLV